MTPPEPGDFVAGGMAIGAVLTLLLQHYSYGVPWGEQPWGMPIGFALSAVGVAVWRRVA